MCLQSNDAVVLTIRFAHKFAHHFPPFHIAKRSTVISRPFCISRRRTHRVIRAMCGLPPRSCRSNYTPFGGAPPIARLTRDCAVEADTLCTAYRRRPRLPALVCAYAVEADTHCTSARYCAVEADTHCTAYRVVVCAYAVEADIHCTSARYCAAEVFLFLDN